MRALPQTGIFAMGSRSHFYLELDLLPGVDPDDLLELIGAGLSEPRATTGGTNLVVGLGPDAWAATGRPSPDGFGAFTERRGPDGFTMPAEQHDVWVWIAGTGYDDVFDVARAVAVAFAPLATVATQRHGFTYKASQDLSGFEDGTENPPIDEAPFICSVPDGRPGAGGSIVLFQRWVHDLEHLHGLTEQEQERIIGRTKATSEELPDELKPASAHIERVVIEEDGEELEVFRRSTPYGDLEEHGLLFVAFSADQRRLDRMLDRMVGNGDGVRDAITTWSTPMAGAFYFAPPIEAPTADG